MNVRVKDMTGVSQMRKVIESMIAHEWDVIVEWIGLPVEF